MKKFLVSGIAAGIVILILWLVLSSVFATLFPYDVLTLAGMRQATDPVMLLFFLHPFVMGFGLAFVYLKLEKAIKGDAVTKGMSFGTLMWFVGGLPSAFSVFTSMNYPIGFTLDSLIGSAIEMLAAGITIAWAQERF